MTQRSIECPFEACRHNEHGVCKAKRIVIRSSFVSDCPEKYEPVCDTFNTLYKEAYENQRKEEAEH